MTTTPLRIKDLKANPKNPRRITDAKRKQLARTLAYYGDLGGIVFNRTTGQLVGGHMRLSTFDRDAQVTITEAYDVPTKAGTVALGHATIDGERFAYREVQWDDVVEKAANLAANKGAGEFDLQQVDAWLTELDAKPFDLDMTLFDADERAALPKAPADEADADGAAADEAVPEAPADPITKLGDVYRLGRHTLRCGDSSDKLTIEQLVAGAQVHMVYSDPPYGMRLDTNYAKMNVNKARPEYKAKYGKMGTIPSKQHRPVHGDDQDYDPTLLLTMFAGVKEMFLWGADYYCQMLPKEGSWVVWDKRSKETGELFPDFHGAHFEMCWSRVKHQKLVLRHLWCGLAQQTRERYVHPTQKPVAVALWFFERWGKPQDTVVDLYGGSGSTLLACEKTGRTCLMMEIDPGYCDVIVQRWEKLTGAKAQLIGNGTAAGDAHA